MCERVPVVELADAPLNLAITAAARAEAAAAGYRLSCIAELADRRLGSEIAKARQRSAFDGWDACAAEVAANLLISHRKASGLMYQAIDLRDRIRLVGDLLRRGDIGLRVAACASWRTQLIEDDALLAKVDAELAEAATRWGSYSEPNLNDAIDAIVARHDPDAVRRFRALQKSMDIQFGKPDDETGTRTVRGRVDAATAEIGHRRMDMLAKTVCPDDPRNLGERRVAAYGVIMAGGDVLPCLCANPDCPAPTGADARGRLFEILVLTDDPDAGSHVDDPQPPPDDGSGPDPRIDDPDYDMSQHWYDDPPPDDEDQPPPPDDVCDDPDGDAADPENSAPAEDSPPEPEPEPEQPPIPEPTPAAPLTPCNYTTIFAGGTIIPPPLLADLRRMGAAVRTVVDPAEFTAEARYRPSMAQQRFVRARDMTCRFPGCNHPAEYCDIDHTIPYADSRLTHPGNTKALCRKHHLLKTFWVGRGGWSDEQLPDGTVVWTSPAGLKHRAPPGSRIYFPNWDPTTPLPDTPVAATTEHVPGRELQMPKRRRTRAQQRAADITAERKRNHEAAERDAVNNPAPF